MTIGDKVGYEAYLGCSDIDIIYGTITKEYGDSFIITDRDGVEHTCYDKNNLFKVDTFPLRCKKIFDHYVYEDGTILRPDGVKKYIGCSEAMNGLYCKFNKTTDVHTVARVVYKLFIESEFDLNNKDYCITFKDGNILNTHWSNLEKITRAELNRRIGENKVRK